MAIPSKIIGGGNNSVAQNVVRVAFSQTLSAAPVYKIWDNGSTYPAADAAGATTVKEAFTGTVGNSNKPEYALVDTTSTAPTSNWLPASATAGSANPNRMKGSTNYVTSPITPSPYTAPTAPSVADASVSGNLNGAYRYYVTFIVGTSGAPKGETLASSEVTITVTNSQVNLTSIPTGPAGVIYRRIYRTVAGGSSNTGKLVTQIADNSTTTYTDNIADGSLGVSQPTIDTSASIRFNLTAEFPYDSAVPSSSSQNVLLEVSYQYTGSAPTLTYWYNDGGTEGSPSWTQFTPGTNGIRFVNASTVSGTYKFTLPQTGVAVVGELWVTT